ncbi:MAG: alanine racemase [Cyclobacteriaceae bacterium]|nr:alanine racemase [Cyclobacteriaceae bacterium]
MNRNSYIEISKSAYHKNLAFIKKLIGDQSLFSSVVKGNAYGHGIESFIPLAESAGVRHFSVFDSHEALRVKKASKDDPGLMIMGWIAPDSFEWIIQSGIEFFVFDFERLKIAVELAKKLRKKARIHLEIETGMNRTGFQEIMFRDVFQLLERNQAFIELMGICTHLAGAENIANHYRLMKQIRFFNEFIRDFRNHGFSPRYIHAACSAGVINYPEIKYNMVRIGILQYGFWPSRETLVQYIGKKTDRNDPLHRIIQWKTEIMDTKWVGTGEFIGYGTSYMAEQDTRIASIPVGYAHGYSRSLSNTGRVLVNGQRMGVIGMVNMNMMVIDITSIPGAKTGDEVVIIGNQGDLSVSVASFSELSNQLNYEMLTRISSDIPRKIIE